MKLNTSTSGSSQVELLIAVFVVAVLAVLAVALTARAVAITEDVVNAVDRRFELIDSFEPPTLPYR